MTTLIYHILDYFFLLFHSILILFNMFGWISKKTRKIHLFSISVTSFSWFVLGFFYGWGYCFCTDWHWLVREELGNPIKSYSYIHFLLTELTGLHPDPVMIDLVTVITFFIIIIISISIQIADYLRKRHLYR